MKTLKKIALELIEVVFIPESMELGKIYYSKEYNVTNHLCPCGCGSQTPLPIKEGEWMLHESDKGISITPSIKHRYNCLSHYVIQDGFANMLNYPIPKDQWHLSKYSEEDY